MLYVKPNKKNDMWFVWSATIKGDSIVKIFYIESKADEYVKNNQGIKYD